MNRSSALLRVLMLASAAALSACVTSPYYTPASGSVYYVDDPWFYRNSYRDCYDVWYGCSRPYYGHSSYYGGYQPPPPDHYHPPPSHPRPPEHRPPDDRPVYAPKPPRLIRIDEAGPAPGRVIRPAPAAKPAAPVRAAPRPAAPPAGNRRQQQVVAAPPGPPTGRQVRGERPSSKPAPVGHARVFVERKER
jgi:hypothetical protein